MRRSTLKILRGYVKVVNFDFKPMPLIHHLRDMVFVAPFTVCKLSVEDGAHSY